MKDLIRNDIPTNKDRAVAEYINRGMNKLKSGGGVLNRVQDVQNDLIAKLEERSVSNLEKMAKKLRKGGEVNKVIGAEENARWYLEGAKVDLATGLPTKFVLKDELARLLGLFSRKVLINNVLLIGFDLNDFKKINDNYTQAHGDEAVKIFAQALRSVLRSGTDMAFRKNGGGGDEFYLLLELGKEDKINQLHKIIRDRVFAKVAELMKQRDDFVWVVKKDGGKDIRNIQGNYMYAATGSIKLTPENIGKLTPQKIMDIVENRYMNDKKNLKVSKQR